MNFLFWYIESKIDRSIIYIYEIFRLKGRKDDYWSWVSFRDEIIEKRIKMDGTNVDIIEG